MFLAPLGHGGFCRECSGARLPALLPSCSASPTAARRSRFSVVKGLVNVAAILGVRTRRVRGVRRAVEGNGLESSEDIEVECLFYAVTRGPDDEHQRVAVVVGPQNVRLMFIDLSAPLGCSWPALPLGEPQRLECSSYVFSWPPGVGVCIRRSRVKGPVRGQLLEFADRGAFAQSMYSPTDGLWLDDYVDVFAAACLMAEDEPSPVVGRIGLVGLGAGTSARQLLQLLPNRTFVAWETSKAVLMAAEFCGGITFDRLEVRTDDILKKTTEITGGWESLAMLLVDVHVDGGDWGDGRLPEELEDREVWRSLLARLAAGGRLVVNLGSTSRGVHAFVNALMAAQDAADELRLQVWATIYANVPKKGTAESLEPGGGNLMLLFGTLPRQLWQRQAGRLKRSAEWLDLRQLLDAV